MPEKAIEITPAVLRQMADRHDRTAAEIAASRAAGDGILAAVATLGPIMHPVKTAMADVIASREAALAAHEADPRTAADTLREAADRFAAQDDRNAADADESVGLESAGHIGEGVHVEREQLGTSNVPRVATNRSSTAKGFDDDRGHCAD